MTRLIVNRGSAGVAIGGGFVQENGAGRHPLPEDNALEAI